VALAMRLAIVAWAHVRFPPVDDAKYYEALARRLAAGQGYTWAWPDGAITAAAHYPVGYPALLAAAYLAFGASLATAMTVNAVLGAAGAFATHRLSQGPNVARWRPAAAAMAVALHPALVPYTAALMTEGVTASMLVIAAALAAQSRGRRGACAAGWLGGAGLAMAVTTLIRPQSLVLAPILGGVAVPAGAPIARRLGRAAAVTAVAIACILPWTARNCVQMHRCALVSVNGGWNLLIGATTPNGGWQALSVPTQCATVWDEAGKDTCFERAATQVIARDPWIWLGRIPAKLAMTFDFFGAAPYYLHASNPAAFGQPAQVAMAGCEVLACRLFLLGALVAAGRLDGACPRWRKAVALGGAVLAVTLDAWGGYLALCACLVLAGRRALAQAPPLVPLTAAVIAATAAVHAVFFGAGRYGLVVAPFVAAVAFVPAFLRPDPGRGPVLDVLSLKPSMPLERSSAAPPAAGGKSELHRARCRVTPGGGNAEESATENRPPSLDAESRATEGKGEKAG